MNNLVVQYFNSLNQIYTIKEGFVKDVFEGFYKSTFLVERIP